MSEQEVFTDDEQFVETDPASLLGDDEDIDRQKVQVGPHPLGGIALAVTGPDGTQAVARLDIEQAWTVIGHMNAVCAMMIMQAYAMAAQSEAAAKKIHIPRH